MTGEVLFRAGPWRCSELGAADVVRLQGFFTDNPEYFHSVRGAPPDPEEAQREHQLLPPEDWIFGPRRLLGFEAEDGTLEAMANLVEGLLAADVWHLGLFIVATPLHGTGASRTMYEAIEARAARSGARWMRLGVVAGNARAERFWERAGFQEVRRRDGEAFGDRVQDIRVMVKPLGAAGMDEYLARVPRDRPGAP